MGWTSLTLGSIVFPQFFLAVLSLELFYGNEVIERPDANVATNPRIYMDYNTSLSWGVLRKFQIYTIPLKEQDPVFLRLQIWEPSILDGFQLGRLKWEKRVQISQFGTKLEFPVTDDFEVTKADRIGFTNEGTINPVSYTEVQGQDRVVYFRRIYTENREPFPTVDDMPLSFGKPDLFFPAVFSIGILADNEPYLSGNSDDVFYGNQVRARKNYLKQGAKRAFIDDNIQLSPGILSEIIFYGGNVDQAKLPLHIRFQLWEKTGDSKFRLFWEKRETLRNTGAKRYQVSLSSSERVAVTASHKIGWTYESDTGPIMYDFNDHPSIRFLAIEENNYPEKGQVYDFGFPYPWEFSVGVLISQGDDPASGGDGNVGTDGNGPSNASDFLQTHGTVGWWTIVWMMLVLLFGGNTV